MKITRINLSNLHNEEHFQYHTEFKTEVTQVGAKALNIDAAFTNYLLRFDKEEKALLLIRKSVTSDQLAVADTERDDIFRGVSDAVRSGLNHFDPGKRMAAARLKVVFDKCGNVARKPYNEETAAIRKLMLEIRGEYAGDVETLSLGEWFAQLEAKDNAFDSLMKIRYSEEANRTELRMNEVRLEVDAAYRSIVERIEALILVYDADRAVSADYETFVRELNARVEKYNAILAIRKGHSAKSADKAGSKV